MTLIATENKRFSETVKYELEPSLAYCRDAVIVNDSAADLVIGQVLGKVTATGKYKVSVEDANDGSEVPCAVVIRDTSVAEDTDTAVLALVNGPAIVSKGNITYDASFNTATEIAFVFSSLEAVGIKANVAV